MNSEEQFSLVVSEALDVLGCSKDMVTSRRAAYDNLCKVFTDQRMREQTCDMYETICGSKREGLTCLHEGDTDFMRTFKHVQCSDDSAAISGDVSYIFELDRANVPGGYTKLRLFRRNPKQVDVAIENSLVPGSDGRWYLSSSAFLEEASVHDSDIPSHRFTKYQYKRRSGPSHPLTGQDHLLGSSLPTDHVISFPCKCSDYIQAWINRPRGYDWPSRDQIEAAAALDAHVVPVGCKGSEEEHLQWRICYTLTEILLMQSLIETQWKLYVLLKMIKDIAFKPLGDLLTSYVMKNVVMWIFESDPTSEMQPRYILRKLRKCFDFLIRSFRSKEMPSFMIRDRNLYLGKLNDSNCKEHLDALNQIRRNCTAMLLRCPKLKQTMVKLYTDPDSMQREMSERNSSELMCLRYSVLQADQPDVLQRATACTTSDGYVNVLLQFIADHPLIVAAKLGVTESAVVHWVNMMKLMPSHQLMQLFRRNNSKLYHEMK